MLVAETEWNGQAAGPAGLGSVVLRADCGVPAIQQAEGGTLG